MSLSEVYQRIARIISDLHHAPIVQKRVPDSKEALANQSFRYALLNRSGNITQTNLDAGYKDRLLEQLDLAEVHLQAPRFYLVGEELVVATRFHGTGDDCWIVPLRVDDTEQILIEKSSSKGFTPSEIRLLHALLSGLSVRESASLSGHSYETKRSQLKSLGAKLDISSQNELVRLTTLWIFNEVLERVAAAAQGSATETDFARTFCSTHFKDQIRYFQISAGERQTIRFAEAGAATGEPVILLHGNVLPPLKPSFFEALAERNIRLIMPFRDGFLTNQVEYIPADQQIERHALQMETLLHFLNQKSVTLIGYSTGTAYALDFAIKHPSSVNRVIFAASSYFMSKGESPVNKFMRNIRKLSRESEHGTHLLIVFYSRLLRKERDMLNTLRKAYAQCETDSTILETICADPLGRRFFVDSYQASLSSISVDWRMSQRDVWARLDDLKLQAEFIHGSADPLNSARLVIEFLEGNPDVSLDCVPEYGQFLLHDEQSPVIERMRIQAST
ncbi:MAG: alpha/beta hydrolase [Pseudomonadota bacterium]